jgi:hypothetical protein
MGPMGHGGNCLKQVDCFDELVNFTIAVFLSAVEDRDTLRVPGLKSLWGGDDLSIKSSNFLSMLEDKKEGSLLRSKLPPNQSWSLDRGSRTNIPRLLCAERTTRQMLPASQIEIPLASAFMRLLVDWRISSIALLSFGLFIFLSPFLDSSWPALCCTRLQAAPRACLLR